MKLPPKIEILKRASIFNKEIKEYALEQAKINEKYISKIIKEDVNKNSMFRNYEDYLVSIILEKEKLIEKRLPLMFRQKIFSSKEFLKQFVNDLNSIPKEYRIKRVGVFDTETTDIKGYIVSYAFVIEEENNLEEIYELINPQAKINEEAFKVHKISEEEVKNKPTFKEKKEYILKIISSLDMIVGHNILYDLGILKRELERVKHFPNIVKIPIFDTMYYSSDIVVLDKKKMPRLEEAVRFFGVDSTDTIYHNALDDVKATYKVFKKLLEEGKKL